MSTITEHLKQRIHFENTKAKALIPIFDTERPIRLTGDMLPWYTGKPSEHPLIADQCLVFWQTPPPDRLTGTKRQADPADQVRDYAERGRSLVFTAKKAQLAEWPVFRVVIRAAQRKRCRLEWRLDRRL